MYRGQKGGLIKTVIIIVIAIIVLSYFGFDLRSIVEDDQTQDNLGYVWGFVVHVWENYLKGPVLFIWKDVFIDLLWSAFVENFERIKNGEPTSFELNTPRVGD